LTSWEDYEKKEIDKNFYYQQVNLQLSSTFLF